MMLRFRILLCLAGAATSTSAPATRPGTPSSCRCFPGDACWPSAEVWTAFNESLGGKLIATVPLASPCHSTFPGVDYDAARCAEIRTNWARPSLHYATTHSPMAAFFANMSCDPFTAPDARCVVGSYVQYAVRATGARDYQLTLAFARAHNIRLVVRNTGHDYLGKSTGAGALALWTQGLKDISILDDQSDSAGYRGKAMKMGAGVLIGEAQAVAHAQGLVVVAGDCPTVGMAGGYTQGGGTSPLASVFGLAADQVLEWEVVTAQGQPLTATPTKNPDLYWALSGGGGGTYAAVLSMTVKAHPDVQVAGGTLIFSLQQSTTPDAFWGAVTVVLRSLPAFIGAGGAALWQLVDGVFYMPQIFLPKASADDLRNLLLNPVISALQRAGIPYEINITKYNIGGRLIPRSLFVSDSGATALTSAMRAITEHGAALANVVIGPSRTPYAPNGVYPGWRDTLMMAMTAIPYNRTDFQANVDARHKITSVIDPILKELAPDGGAYLNEADYSEPDFQQAFYGSNYARLLSIKNKYDPDGLFWAKTAVGSEGWDVQPDGRLCKVAAV
ncbi:FAD binding domain-containing protein [Achaetomium macrosporum]|uniref:FAD binding domain-containing protein n=1 Tax=Achaetomium macrosporum TaxID=79813 RepID=A0AAN7C117_9PEZI|nr:FAD binding domain-containing protein [Achaetomium macrosporum]